MSDFYTNHGKAILAFLFPFIATVGTALARWVVDGTWNANDVRLAVGGLITSSLAALGAYLGKHDPSR